ncbi:hypothetical protein UM93_06115 [Psychromicrobium lacuslunae]|uniref:Major facilitator superfamily (MFS) profile domain-containing protein n=1 Tax=Psychromicrobium lacuslunae TaxID=1618207 RepID=A0A0D4C2U0_9MICC|nr:hypothetical protein UM93_06115 [Psychromicrobium lacuslunae]
MPVPPSLARLLTVLMPAMLLIPIASDMVALVLPAITREFASSTAQASWVVTGFLLACAIGIPLYGRLADRWSLQRVFIAAILAYAAGSLICALAPSLLTLVIGRVLSGFGGAAIPVLAIVAASRLLPRREVPLGVGAIAAAGGIGAALGPAIGGGLGQLLGWRALFWIMFLAALALVPALRTVLGQARPRSRARLNLIGGALLGLSTGALLFGVTQAEGVGGFTKPTSWAPLLLGAIGLSLVALRSRSAADPFVSPALFRQRGFLGAAGVIFLAMVANLSALVLIPLLIINVNGLSAGEGSLVMVPGGIALALTSVLAGRLGKAGANEGSVSIIGLALIALAMLLMSTVAGRPPLLAALAVTILGTGFALVVTLTTNAVSQLLPSELARGGIGIFQSAQFLGAGTGPALFSVLLSWRQSAPGATLNPLASVEADAYSDIFLALAAVALIAIFPALRLRRDRGRPQ